VVDGAGAHLVSGLKATPLLEALVELAARAPVVWSGTSASAACDPMVDERGGALTVGLGVVDDAIVVPAWEGWSRDARRRLRRLVPADRLVVGLPTGTAIVPGENPEGWSPVGPGVEAERGGEVVARD
jgi:cyanophycinase